MNTPEECIRQSTVLCVDDEPNVLTSLERVLRRFDCRVLLASNGTEAIELLNHEEIDVLICDEAMPGMCGTEVLRRAKTISPATVRILLTAHCGDEDVMLGAVNEGEIFRLLGKPWLDDEIRLVVTEALGGEPKQVHERQKQVQARLRGAT